ncbi:arrestin domain-containing protein 17-like [Pomacea canaliculata]|uniref:arrestin domain-containing protein 17-like n=1 Tax=Pomacea canaliculata TaxID=400727 RepID=UPI000D72BFA7|nr:arrestin domain-containing protein 17-like [Pomacea canaliculata]
MKIEEFDIRFDNEDAVFSAGQNVTGSVVLEISKPTHIFNITIRFEGQAKSSWEVSGGDSNKNYRAYETYIDDSITLYSSDGQGPDVKHPAGHHIYPFSMSLPTSVPSSFEGRRGYVRYQCMAFVDRGWKGMLDCIQDFTVIHHLDLNTLHNVAEPCLVTKEEVYEGCCCDSGVVISKFSLRKTGFVPGEPMMFEISIENKSTSSLCGLSIQLIQTVRYTGYSNSVFSSGNAKYHDKVNAWVLYEIDEDIEAQKTFTLHNYALIPAVAPSLLEGCNIISTMYQVSLRVPVGWNSTDLSVAVTIGTVPLYDANRLSNVAAPPQRMSIIDPPPSYEECVFGRMTTQSGENADIDADEEQPVRQRRREFRRMPSYPYYNMQVSTENGQQPTTPPSPSQLPPPSYDSLNHHEQALR